MFKNKLALLLVSLFSLAMAAGCAKPDLIVLMPDASGRVGKVTVTTGRGTAELNQAGQATSIGSPGAAPSKPAKMKPGEIKTIFGRALAAQPEQPAYFMLYFKSDSTKLLSSSRALLPKVVAEVRRRKSRDISVVGHADTFGAAAYNMRLSQRRAERVAKILVKRGLDPATMEISSHGDTNPLIKTGKNVREPRNRRVQVTVR